MQKYLQEENEKFSPTNDLKTKEDAECILKKYDIDTVYYGHIHGRGIYNIVPEYEGIKLKHVAADGVNFTPQFVSKCNLFEKV